MPEIISGAALPLATLFYASLNAILTIVLAWRVGVVRMRNNVAFGDGGCEPLQRAIRAHGNNTEYVPLALILLALVEMVGAPAMLVHGLGAVLFAGRVLHAVGLSATTGPNPPRAVGILLTWAAILVSAGYGLYAAISH